MLASTFNARSAAQTDLIRKPEFDAKLKGISDQVTKNNTKHLLVERGKNYFEGNDGAQNALVFQTKQKHFNLSNVNQISKWNSKGLYKQYLDAVGTLGDVVLSKPIKPTDVIFKGKSTLVQNNNNLCREDVFT